MKKTTKKLISIFLSLLMVLSLIPMGSMTAFAGTEYTITISSGGVYDIPEGAYSATSEDTIKIRNNTLDDITAFVENWSDTIPLNYYYAWGDTTYTLPPFPAGKHVNGITTNGDSITFTLADDPTADFTASHFFCSVCKGAGKSFIANYSGDVQDHYMSAHEDDIIAAFDCTHECIPANPCGNKNCPNTPVPTCGLCAVCGHPQGRHNDRDDWCDDCKFGDGGACNGEILFEPCVLPEGHTGAHTAWTTITDTNEINTLLAKLVGSYKYKYSQNGNTLTIYGDSTNGYKFAYYSNGTETDLTLSVVQQKGNHYYIGFGNIGFTFIFDEEDNLSNIYKAWVKNDGTVNKYYDSEYIYSGPAVCGLCVVCGHKENEHGEYCEPCDMTSGPCNDESMYVACVLDKGHTGNHSDGTPEWVETIVAKVDASADKLVDDQGTPFANMLMGGKFADTFNQYESFEYDNDGSVYTIKGIGNGADGEFIITLDSNEDVASLVTNFYAAGTLMFAVTYTPVPPHTCTLAKKNGQAATCTKDGWKAYYQCKDKACGKIYATNNASGTAYDTLTAWKASKAGKIAKTGHSYTSAVTKKATYSAEGVRTYTCSKCGNKYTKAIAKLELTSDAKYSNSTKMNAGFKVSSSTKNVTVNWGKVAGADGYMIYAAYCGNDTKAQLIKTIKGVDTKTYTFTKLNGKNIDLTKNMKVYVVAYSTIDGKKVQVGKSIVGHVVGGKSKKYTNSTKVTVKNSNVTLAVNKTSKISATVTYKDATKKPVGDSHAPAKRYRSSNKAVATVDANGKITAVGKGTCTVYVFAKNGTSAKVTVTVK